MQDFQQRVVDEHKELASKLDKLNQFIKGDIYKSLPGDEQMRLNHQAKAMSEYAFILNDRIAHFNVP